MRSPIARLSELASVQPAAAAVISSKGTVTYATLLHAVRVQARYLHASGIRREETVAVAFSAHPDLTVQQIAQFYAIAWLGAAILPLYPGMPLALHVEIAEQLGANWLISDAMPSSVGRVRWLDSRQWIEMEVDDAPDPPCVDDASLPFLYEFSSGTSGTPKAVCYTNAQYIAKALVTASQYEWNETDVMVPAVRWPSKVGVRAVARALVVGASYADFPFPQSAAQLSGLVEVHGVSYVSCSPWQVRRLLASANDSISSPFRVKKMGVVGAHIAPDEIHAARVQLCNAFCVRYAVTEIGTIGFLGPDDRPEDPFRLVPGMQCQALGDDGQPLPVGQVGRLRFCAPWIPARYATGNRDPVEGFHGGWFVSSDLGAVDAQGHVVLGGRADDAINVGGTKVHPHEVEQALVMHPDVVDAALVGVPDAMAGEIAVAFLVLRRPIALDAMLAFLAPRLASHQIPAAIAGVEAIPRNPEGKIVREPLRTLYAQLRTKAGTQT